MPDVSIRRVSELIRDIEDGALILKPSFQRRLVWTNVVKDKFLETVILGLPFPEIFVATGEIDTKTMKRKNLLVDGQQRISTLREYVQGSKDLILDIVQPYNNLTDKQKAQFLDYKVAVRDLGMVNEEQVKDIFARINSTDYSLKAMERLNAQFSGHYKQFCDDLSHDAFFVKHSVFSMGDYRRMRDLDFCVILVTTLLTTYYHRDTHNMEYLRRYNDKFPKSAKLGKQLASVFQFIEACDFHKKSRIWKKTDLFTAIIEIYAALIREEKPLDPAKVHDKLSDFYDQVTTTFKDGIPDEELDKKSEEKSPTSIIFRYLKAATKATNDKYSRVIRAEIITTLLDSTLSGPNSPLKNG